MLTTRINHKYVLIKQVGDGISSDDCHIFTPTQESKEAASAFYSMLWREQNSIRLLEQTHLIRQKKVVFASDNKNVAQCLSFTIIEVKKKRLCLVAFSSGAPHQQSAALIGNTIEQLNKGQETLTYILLHKQNQKYYDWIRERAPGDEINKVCAEKVTFAYLMKFIKHHSDGFRIIGGVNSSFYPYQFEKNGEIYYLTGPASDLSYVHQTRILMGRASGNRGYCSHTLGSCKNCVKITPAMLELMHDTLNDGGIGRQISDFSQYKDGPLVCTLDHKKMPAPGLALSTSRHRSPSSICRVGHSPISRNLTIVVPTKGDIGSSGVSVAISSMFSILPRSPDADTFPKKSNEEVKGDDVSSKKSRNNSNNVSIMGRKLFSASNSPEASGVGRSFDEKTISKIVNERLQGERDQRIANKQEAIHALLKLLSKYEKYIVGDPQKARVKQLIKDSVHIEYYSSCCLCFKKRRCLISFVGIERELGKYLLNQRENKK